MGWSEDILDDFIVFKLQSGSKSALVAATEELMMTIHKLLKWRNISQLCHRSPALRRGAAPERELDFGAMIIRVLL